MRSSFGVSIILRSYVLLLEVKGRLEDYYDEGLIEVSPCGMSCAGSGALIARRRVSLFEGELSLFIVPQAQIIFLSIVI